MGTLRAIALNASVSRMSNSLRMLLRVRRFKHVYTRSFKAYCHPHHLHCLNVNKSVAVEQNKIYVYKTGGKCPFKPDDITLCVVAGILTERIRGVKLYRSIAINL